MERAEAIKRIKELGVNNVHIRPFGLKGWGILHQIDLYHAEVIFKAYTEDECRDLIKEIVGGDRK